MNQKIPQNKPHVRMFLALLTFALTRMSLPLAQPARANSAPAPPTGDCAGQAFIAVEKVEYKGKNSEGKDLVRVTYRTQATSECVWFGSGFDVPGDNNIKPFGQEMSVKVRRRFGHEDSNSFKSVVAVNGSQVLSTQVDIPRALLETDPVSFEVKVRTTVGVVLTRTARLTGNGAPSLSTAAQTFTKHSSLPDRVADDCFPTVQVSALNFIPGAGPKPDRVTISAAAGFLPAVAACFDPPKVSIVVRVTRPNGVVDSRQANLGAGATTATVSLPGTPGSVASFEVLVSASSGSVVEKSTISTGPFN